MRTFRFLPFAAGLLLPLLATRAAAQTAGVPPEAGLVRPNPVLSQVVSGMPTGAEQEIRVFTATFKPGDRTVFHTHRQPVTVYVLEGEFSLEMAGRPTEVVRAGTAFVEPPHVRMTGYNRSTSSQTRVVVFYVSTPGEPFLDPIATVSDQPSPPHESTLQANAAPQPSKARKQ
jgi:quercetin dioxygenase-like cupin family protein